MVKFEVIDKTEAPDPVRGTNSQWKPVIQAFDELDFEQAIIIELRNIRERDQLSSMMYYYFGKGAHSMKCIDRNSHKYVITKK